MQSITQVLSLQQQSLALIGGLTATGQQERLKTALEVGLGAGLTVNQIKEAQVRLCCLNSGSGMGRAGVTWIQATPAATVDHVWNALLWLFLRVVAVTLVRE